MEITSLRINCCILCVKAMPTNPTQEKWSGTCFTVKGSQVISNIIGQEPQHILGHKVERNSPESMSNKDKVIMYRFSWASFPYLVTEKKIDAFKLLNPIFLREIIWQNLVLWPLHS